jgi:hypothetical protein
VNDLFVSPQGSDHPDGSRHRPFPSINAAVEHAHAGDTVWLLEGTYYERVRLDGLGDAAGDPLVIASVSGRRTTIIDGALRDFAERPHDMWEPMPPATPPVVTVRTSPTAPPPLPAGNVFRSTTPLPPGTDRGSFLTGRTTYTRLITYDMVRDLIATNEKFGKLPRTAEDPPGPMVWGADQRSPYPRRPWVYMGPGLWQESGGHLQVRLSHTTLVVPGGEDYQGETDPRKLPLAIWGGDEDGQTLAIRASHRITIRDVTLRHGAGETVMIASSSDIALDHVVVNAGPNGVRLGEGCERIIMVDTVVDGGMPPWFFRSDRKDDYRLGNGSHNLLGKRTLNLLIQSDGSAVDTRIEQCELVNGHDLQLNGTGVAFTRNWVHNLNDDGIFIGAVATDLWIVANVVEQCLMALTVRVDSDVGSVFVHRNLIDLRRPTLGRRPHPRPELMPPKLEPQLRTYRFGNLTKYEKADPEINLTHNTVLVVDQEFRSAYNVFREYRQAAPRRTFNNIFVAINRSKASDLPIAYLPAATDEQCETDGNCYWRIGRHSAPLFKVRDSPQEFTDLDDLHGSAYFTQSAAHHGGRGFEAHAVDEDPRLRRYWPPFELPGVEDLRVAHDSPVVGRGVDIGDLLHELLQALPDPTVGASDLGCYPLGAPPLRVGVDRRLPFPRVLDDHPDLRT